MARHVVMSPWVVQGQEFWFHGWRTCFVITLPNSQAITEEHVQPKRSSVSSRKYVLGSVNVEVVGSCVDEVFMKNKKLIAVGLIIAPQR